MKHRYQIALLLSLVAIARPASAQEAAPEPEKLECSEYVPPEERNDPQRLALRGVACFESKQYLLALRHYRRARELSDANLLNAAIGRTFQELGYPFIARRYFRDYLSSKIEEKAGRKKIEERLEAVTDDLEKNGAKVRVESSPPGSTVYLVIQGSHHEEIGVTPIDVEMRAGRHKFVVEREGYITHETTVDVGSKLDRIVQTDLVREGADFPVAGRTLRRNGVFTMAASLPLLVGGPSLYLIGRNKRSSVDELPLREQSDATKSATRLQNWGIVASVTGVVAFGTGLTLYLVGRSMDDEGGGPPAPEGKKKASLTPYVDGETVGFVWTF